MLLGSILSTKKRKKKKKEKKKVTPISRHFIDIGQKIFIIILKSKMTVKLSLELCEA